MNIDAIDLLILILATWRVANMFVNEDGPFDVFLRLRIRAGIVHDENGKSWQIPDQFFAKLLSCIWCSSVWIGAFFAGGYIIIPYIMMMLALPLAFSAGAILVNIISKD